MKKQRKTEGRMPTHADVPHVRPPKRDIRRLEETDKELWTAKQLKKDDRRFREDAGFLTRLLRRFRRL